MIRVVNLRNYVPKDEKEVLIRVDRKTILGNPFIMHNESERDSVCDQYIKYFNEKLEDAKFKEALEDIAHKALCGDVALGCWCYPKRCHAETIQKYVELMISCEKCTEGFTICRFTGERCGISYDEMYECKDCMANPEAYLKEALRELEETYTYVMQFYNVGDYFIPRRYLVKDGSQYYFNVCTDFNPDRDPQCIYKTTKISKELVKEMILRWKNK